MGTKSIKCPDCGGQIRINTESTVTVCEFCGASISTTDAMKMYKGAVETVKGEGAKEYLLKMADDCLERGFYFEAEKKYREVADEYPNDYRGWWGICRSVPVNVDRFDSLGSEYERAIAFAPRDKIREIKLHMMERLETYQLKLKEKTRRKDLLEHTQMEINMLD